MAVDWWSNIIKCAEESQDITFTDPERELFKQMLIRVHEVMPRIVAVDNVTIPWSTYAPLTASIIATTILKCRNL